MATERKEIITDAGKKGDERKKKEWGKWLLAPTAALIISTALNCGDSRPVYDPIPPGSDAGQADASQADGATDDGGLADGDQVNGDQADGGPQVDGDGGLVDGEVVDAGPSDGDVTDGGMVDGGETDGGQVDGEVVDGGDEMPAACEGVYNDSLTEGGFPINEPVNVGGYSITYVDYTHTTVVVDIKCATTGEEVATGVSMTGLVENVVEAPQDGKKIIVVPLMKNGWRMSANVWVEDL